MMDGDPKGVGAGLAHDVLHAERKPLDAIFSPRTVAVIGATEKPGSVGRTILWNLISNPFGGTVFPVNPTRPNVLGIKAYKRVADVPEPVDLAIIVTPAATVPDVIGECAEVGVRGAIVISAGFKEVGTAGADLERRVLEQARKGRMRLIGPNCLGVMRPLGGLNATFAGRMALPGTVGFLSQSGALCTAILDWSLREHVGFSAFVSIGSMLDVGWGDLIDYLGDDPRTKCIVIYMETVGDARSFLSAAREVALTKPIIAIKAGRTEAAAKAAASHTGSLAGSDEVLDAAFRRCGVLRVDTISEVFYMAEVLAKQPRPKGSRLTIVTNAGGPGVLATDALIRRGGSLAELAPETVGTLNTFLPDAWSHSNPIDVLGDADAGRYAKTLEAVAKDPNSDGLLVILTPQAMSEPTQTAEQLRPFARIEGKPVLASWMGGADVAAGEMILNQAGIPTFPYPDTGARVFQTMWRSAYNLKGLYETPTLPDDSEDVVEARSRVDALGSAVRQSGRTILTEFESKQILALYGIPTVPTRVAHTEDEAVAAAEEIGYPAVLKLFSESVTHKTDVGGVQLNLTDADSIRRAYRAIDLSVLEHAGPGHFQGVTIQPMIRRDGYELIVGSSLDSQFGPVLLFGTGGQLVEVFRDRALALPPLTTTLARRMMEQTRIFEALRGVRGRKPVDVPALEQLLVRFSRLVVEQPWIREMDINPLLASPEGLLALDARVIAHDISVPESEWSRPAIRPYPIQYVSPWVAKDGAHVLIRPIRPEDELLLIRFHETLSERSVAFRYFHAMKLSSRTSHDRLTRICFNDYDREMALVADGKDPATGTNAILGVGRLSKLHGQDEAEFAMLVSDGFQGRGLGSEFLRRLIQIGRDEKLSRISADILPENREMQAVCRKLGFHLAHEPGDGVVKAVIEL
ncbi:bifunctional acetate--CoA ligase family protein/GNAT family N-acetyltransferase [Singulisphaera sp. PoT]|uniref:bifunctional acetate--CoA ligase family protein/GNAT family N-acetyltransferase n=1 Tax=Singulisphaera sp. PoT TaxID=3411797 RepID=UPI003BF4FC37